MRRAGASTQEEPGAIAPRFHTRRGHQWLWPTFIHPFYSAVCRLLRVKTWLRSSMIQSRLNNAVLLHCHRHMMPNLESVINDFVNFNDLRERVFGVQHKATT